MLHVTQLVGFGARSGPSIQFVGSNIAGRAGSTSTTTMQLDSDLTGGIASAAESGDFVLAIFAVGGADGTDPAMAIDDGSVAYTIAGTDQRVNGGAGGYWANLKCAYKFITSDTSVRFGSTGNANYAGAHAVFVFRGVNTSNPLDVSVVEASSFATAYADPPAITPVTPGAIIIAVGSGATANGSGTYSQSGLTSFRTVGANDTVDVVLGAGLNEAWAGGAFDPAAWTFSLGSSAADTWAAKCIAIRPK